MRARKRWPAGPVLSLGERCEKVLANAAFSIRRTLTNGVTFPAASDQILLLGLETVALSTCSFTLQTLRSHRFAVAGSAATALALGYRSVAFDAGLRGGDSPTWAPQ